MLLESYVSLPISLREFTDWLLGALPDAAKAIAILCIGWLIAIASDALVRRLLIRVERSIPGQNSRTEFQLETQRTAKLMGRGVRWLVVLLFIIITGEAIGLTALSSWLGEVATYVPRILVAIIIGFAAIVAARFIQAAVTRTARAAAMPQAEQLGKIANFAVLFTLGLVVIDQLGVEISLIAQTLEIALAAILGGAALAFGLGARTTVENVLAAHYVRKSYEIGHTIRLGETEGRIVSMGPTSIVVSTKAGKVMIPTREFSLVNSARIESKDRP